MKEKLKKVTLYLITAAATLCAGFIFAAFLLRPQPLQIGTVDLGKVADGSYIGVCQNKILFVVVRVEIRNHAIRGIEVIGHKASYRTQAEQIARAVCSEQSLKVDAISGATLTSDTVLKAIENALEGVEEPSDRKKVLP